MSSSLTEDYLRWLEPQIRDTHGELDKSYWGLLEIMFEKDFVGLVPNDDNRVRDGLDLRVEFCYRQHIHGGSLDYLGPNVARFIEVLIGISRRLSFMASGKAPGWAWQLLDNLELRRMYDPLRRSKIDKIHDILDAVIWRNYEPSGQGGFFPLAWSEEDQTKVEIWYQMNAYINEMHPEY